MKRIFLIISLLFPIVLQAQNEELIKNLIAKSDSIYQLANEAKKASFQIEKLKEVIVLNDSCFMLLREEYDIMKPKADVYDFFSKNDTTVFGSDFIKFDVKNIPHCLVNYYISVSQIHNLKNAIEEMYEKIKKAESDEIAPEKMKSHVAIMIETDVNRINKLCDIIDSTGISCLSKKQQEYYSKNLINRFNDVLNKYIF